jgi:hypothetical protein
MVVRDPRTETSFGVNLKLHTESALVDPKWLETQQIKGGSKTKAKERSTDGGTNLATPLDDKPPTMPLSAPSSSHKVMSTKEKSPKDVSEQNPSTHVNSQFDIVCKSEGTKQEGDESMQKPSATIPTKNDSSKSMNNITINPRTNSAVQLGSDASIREIVKACLDNLVSSVETSLRNKSLGSATSIPIVQKRKRRRRVNFSVMQVIDAEKQNSRRPDVDLEKKLKPGDIVVAVQSHELNGMKFQDACGEFSKRAERANDALIQTQVVVARKKPIVVPAKVSSAGDTNPTPVTQTPPTSETTTSEISPSDPLTSEVATSSSVTPIIAPQLAENTSMVFSPAEIATMTNCFLQTLHNSSRVLGLDIQDSAWHAHTVVFRMGTLLKDTALTTRSSVTLRNKWSHLTRFMDYNLAEKGKTFWTDKFRDEFGDEKIPFSSEVERHAMRQLPRPSKGCRCKRKDHEYLFDSKCTLYRDIQRRVSKEELTKLRQQKKKKSMSNKDLNVLESAFQKRILKLKTAAENESIEARFVERMEEIQVKELRQAIFAPNLTTIVLSAIFELQREFDASITDDFKHDVEEEDGHDDDVALESLGKRKSDNQSEENIKKQHKISREQDPNLSIRYLIRMLEYVSKTWGHCYREPEKDEYFWRWELYHAVHSDFNQWDAHLTSPREPGSFPFQNVKIGLSASKSMRDEVSSMPKTIRQFEDSILSNSCSSFDLSNEVVDQFALVIHLLSPSRSGLYDELIALLKIGILKISSSGIPVLTEGWWAKIDIVILDEMSSSWSTKADPDSRYCVNEELRDTLEERWVKSDHGWSLLENPKDLIFDFGVLDEWRETFEGRLEEKANLSEGIGRFGL